MTPRTLTYEECPHHSYVRIRRIRGDKDICGCPRTKRTNGIVVYKNPISGNWVVWDVEGWTWLSLSGDWQTSMKTAQLYLEYRRDNPDRGWGILVTEEPSA